MPLSADRHPLRSRAFLSNDSYGSKAALTNGGTLIVKETFNEALRDWRAISWRTARQTLRLRAEIVVFITGL